MHVFVFMMFSFLSVTEWNYLITLSFFISSIEIVGGISPFLIFSITSRATLVASSFVLNPSLPGSAGTLVWWIINSAIGKYVITIGMFWRVDDLVSEFGAWRREVLAALLSGCAGAEGACAKSMVMLMQQRRSNASTAADACVQSSFCLILISSSSVVRTKAFVRGLPCGKRVRWLGLVTSPCADSDRWRECRSPRTGRDRHRRVSPRPH